MARAENLADAIRLSEEDPLCTFCPLELREQARARGFEYRDYPWMPGNVWNTLLDVIGLDNFEPLAWTQKSNRIRGQLLINATGMRNLETARTAQ